MGLLKIDEWLTGTVDRMSFGPFKRVNLSRRVEKIDDKEPLTKENSIEVLIGEYQRTSSFQDFSPKKVWVKYFTFPDGRNVTVIKYKKNSGKIPPVPDFKPQKTVPWQDDYALSSS
jgi:hypothetical protein